MSKGNGISNKLTNCATFSTFKHSDPHPVCGRSTLKDGVVNEHISNDLAKVLVEPNQKSNGLSVNRKCEQGFTTDNRRTLTEVLGADKGASSLQTLRKQQQWYHVKCQMSNVKCLFIVVMRLATLASSQACHLNWRKQIFQMNITGLKIPTGGRQTSWLFTNMTEELNWGPPRNNSSLVVRAGLEPATSGFQVRRPNHSATLPPYSATLPPY